VSGAALAGLVLGSIFAVVVLGALVWSDYRSAHSEATIRRTAEQHQWARSGRW
jgi:hypothetical protein